MVASLPPPLLHHRKSTLAVISPRSSRILKPWPPRRPTSSGSVAASLVSLPRPTSWSKELRGQAAGEQLQGGAAGKERAINARRSAGEKHVEVGRREAACTKRMQDLMRQFGTIMCQITQRKWAWPFIEPVDVAGLGLHDYYEENVDRGEKKTWCGAV